MTATTFRVAGMTCDHCVTAVREEFLALPGVSTVSVDFNPGGLSTVTVASDLPLDASVVAAAVDEVGYEIVT